MTDRTPPQSDETRETDARREEIKNLYLYVSNLPGRMVKSAVLEYLNTREKELRAALKGLREGDT